MLSGFELYPRWVPLLNQTKKYPANSRRISGRRFSPSEKYNSDYLYVTLIESNMARDCRNCVWRNSCLRIQRSSLAPRRLGRFPRRDVLRQGARLFVWNLSMMTMITFRSCEWKTESAIMFNNSFIWYASRNHRLNSHSIFVSIVYKTLNY